MKTVFNLLKETFSEWSEDKASRMAAALSYYTVFSIAPLLVILISVVGLILGREAVQGRLVGQIQSLVGAQSADLIQSMIARAYQPRASIIATILGVITLLFGASGLFAALQDSLNTVWDVVPRPGRSIKEVIFDRALSFAMLLLIGVVLLASFLASTALSAVSGVVGTTLHLAIPAGIWQGVNQVVSFVIIALLFALIFKYLPDVQIGWGDVWVGAAVTSLLFTIGQFGISLYLGLSGVSSAYGAAGSLVVILLWIYYSSLILFFGAEFTQVYARHRGTKVEPARGTMYAPAPGEASQEAPAWQQAASAAAAAQTGKGSGGQAGREQGRPARRPSGVHVFAAQSTDGHGESERAPGAAAAAGAALFAAVVTARLLRRR